jgi:hypothetical protein
LWGKLALQEVCLQTTRHRPRQQRLSCTWRAVEQDTLWRLDTDPHEKLWVLEWQLDDFSQLTDLVVQTTDTAERHLTGILQRHIVHKRVDLAR